MFMRRRRDDDKKKNGKGKRKGRPLARKRICRFCADKKLSIDYKDGKALMAFTTERGKIVPRRISGNCATHQRDVALAIKRARILAFIPFTATQTAMA